jgi:hypothetical protein
MVVQDFLHRQTLLGVQIVDFGADLVHGVLLEVLLNSLQIGDCQVVCHSRLETVVKLL